MERFIGRPLIFKIPAATPTTMICAFFVLAVSFIATTVALSLDVSETPGVASSPHMYGVMFEVSLSSRTDR